MTPNDKLPKEFTKDEILYSNPIFSDNKGSNVYITLEAARLSMDKYADQWKVKHDALKTILQEFVSNHEAGLLPNRFVYEKAIKILNDGTTNK